MSFFRSLPVLTVLAIGLTASIVFADLDKDREQDKRKREQSRAQFIAQQESPQRLEQLALTPCVGGLAGTYPCQNIDLVNFMPLSSIGGGNGNDIWGWTDPMDGREYAIMGRTSGTSFIDISDPENPVYLGNLPPNGANSSWRDVKVYANHAYIVSEASGHGMQVFDLTRLRTVAAPPETFTADSVYTNFGSSHNIAINEDTGFAYSVGTTTCSAGPHFIDLSVPSAPIFAGCHIESFYTHDTQCVVYSGPDSDYTGREICINSNESRINVIDVTDHANPTVISETTYSGTGYVHQGWLTEDQTYYMQGDELDEQNFGHNTRTRILDMTDLDLPLLIGTYDHTTPAIDHNLYTHEGYAYMANYRAGLRIMDLANISAGTLNEVAFFDIYPSSDSANFNGAWSVYPYFASGNVIISGIEQGLFIVRPTLGPDFQVDANPSNLEVCTPNDVMSSLTLTDRNGFIGNVTLSTSALPAGTVASFDVNPVVVPGASQLTLSVGTSAPGSYSVVVNGTDGSISNDKTITLEIADQLPGQPTTLSPVDGAIDQSRTPLLSWNASSQAQSYTLDVATDSGFANIVYSFTTAGTSHTITASLTPLTPYFWRVRADNPCGGGTNSTTSTFTTLDVPEILLVDDDDNGPDVVATYADTLTALGRNFDVWNTSNTDDEPSASALDPYKTVIWFTGDEFGGAAGPGGGGEQALSAWLDQSRCLMISSQDYFYDRGLTGFMQSHLGVASATSDVGQLSASGAGAVFGGLGPYTFAFPYTNYTDTVNPDALAESGFDGSVANIAVNKDTGVYRTAFLGFGIEALPSAADQQAALGAFLSWCDALPDLDGDVDGTNNGNDCAPSDASAWEIPSATSSLLLTEAAADNISWLGSAAPGGIQPLYDVLRSLSASDFMSGACMESGESDTLATDAAIPQPGEFYYYLIRAHNSCGGTLGDAGRTGVTCP
jgi:choice-of-anchor B domain-containing protein